MTESYPWHLRLTELKNSGGLYKDEVLKLVNDWMSFWSLGECGDHNNCMPEYAKKMVESRAKLPHLRLKEFLNSTDWESVHVAAYAYHHKMDMDYYAADGGIAPTREIEQAAVAYADRQVAWHRKRVNKFINGVGDWTQEVSEVDALWIRLIEFGKQEFPNPK